MALTFSLAPVFVLNGPNLNLLGEREPHLYGVHTLEDVRRACEERAARLGARTEFRQSNHEGVLVDWLQEARRNACAVVLNAGAYTHTSIAILDAARSLNVPLVECHLSNPGAREPYRRRSFVTAAASGVVAGFGLMSYVLAVEAAFALATAGRAEKGTADR